MQILKKIFFPILSIFLLYRSIDLVRGLIASDPSSFLFKEQLLISLLMVLFLTGVFAFTGFAYSTSKILDERYYKIRNDRILNTVYSILFVNHYRKFLLIAFWGRKKNKQKYFDGTRKGIENLIFQSKQSEFGHLGAFLSLCITSVIFMIIGYYEIVLLITLLNILGNLYPIILQRHHRLRLKRIASYS